MKEICFLQQVIPFPSPQITWHIWCFKDKKCNQLIPLCEFNFPTSTVLSIFFRKETCILYCKPESKVYGSRRDTLFMCRDAGRETQEEALLPSSFFKTEFEIKFKRDMRSLCDLEVLHLNWYFSQLRIFCTSKNWFQNNKERAGPYFDIKKISVQFYSIIF